MIRVVLFDVGETLLHNYNPDPNGPPDFKPFTGVLPALDTIRTLHNAAGDGLLLGIVSDYKMPPPATETQVLAIEDEYRTKILVATGLDPFFTPFTERVTISTRAKVTKPARAIFETALARLGTSATLAECVFITENADHLQKAKSYGMTPLGFGTSLAGIVTFTDWTTAPLLLAQLLTPEDVSNLARSAVPTLAAQHGLATFTPTKFNGHIVHGNATQLVQLNDQRLGTLSGIYVERPTTVAVELPATGGLGEVQTTAPDAEELDETVNFVHSLLQSGRIALEGATQGTTHAVKKDDHGRECLVRTRYAR